MIRKVGVIGAGEMGRGIAHVFALGGFPVQLFDIHPAALKDAQAAIKANLARQVKRKLITAAASAKAQRLIRPARSMAAMKNCDLVIEAVIEDEATKKKTYGALCAQLKSSAILATNTSSLPITRLASYTDRPKRFLGIHFMNPAPVMSLVELVHGIATEEQVFTEVRELLVKLGKVPVVSEDFPAFVVNRLLMGLINEAVFALYEGVSTVKGIDTAMRLGANHPMGPLELADFIGLDICLGILQALQADMGSSKYRPCPLLVKYVEAGWLGRKTGRGFYDYRSGSPLPTR